MDLRVALNAVSDVIVNRPTPIREFDQIYMKAADMLLQAEHISRWTDGKRVVFIGDGDAISLCLVHLHSETIFSNGPSAILVLDFDERVINSINRFAFDNNIQDKISARLYNVADALPRDVWGAYDAFYTNPPFGASNCGESVKAFIKRGIEATNNDAIGCVVIADHVTQWGQDILHVVQSFAIANGFVVAEMIPYMHQYHLDDAPDLTSCSLIFKKVKECHTFYNSTPLSEDERKNFYGKNHSLTVRYVHELRDLTRSHKGSYLLVPYDTKEL